MFIVLDTDTLSVHGLDKPYRISEVGEKHVRFCVELTQPQSEVRELEASVEMASPEGNLETKGRLNGAGEGPLADEYEIELRFKRPDKATREALAKLKKAFEKRYHFLDSGDGGDGGSPEDLYALNGVSHEEPAAELGEVEFSKALAGVLGLPFTDLEVSGVDVLQIRDFTREFLLEHLFVPLGKERRTTRVALGRMPLPRTLAAINRRYGDKVRFSVAASSQIVSAVETAFEIRTNRRRAARLAVALRLRVGAYDEQWSLVSGPVDGTTRNISPGGVLVVAQPLLEDPDEIVGKRAGVLIYLPEYDKPLRAAGRFLRSRPVSGPGSALYSYAIEINYMPHEDRRRLDVFRYTLLWGPRRLKVDE